MAVRPFYTESEIDGYKTNVKGGPRNSRGDMTTSIYQRETRVLLQNLTKSVVGTDLKMMFITLFLRCGIKVRKYMNMKQNIKWR